MKAMIFAAGLGTRLRPLTDTMPKALVPVCGKPLLAHVIEKLAASGYDDIVVNVHHFSGQIKDYLASHDFGVKISISDESSLLLETGGAIAHARPLLEASSQPFLVHNVDIISDLDLEWFRREWRPGAIATLLVSERQTKRYFLFDDDMRLVGWTNLETGEVKTPYEGLDAQKCRRLAFAGIHNISPIVFSVFDSYGFSGRFPIVDFYLRVCKDHPIYGVVPSQLKMIDVGKLDSLHDAEVLCSTLLATR
ncbi:MAG: nucleotidyltransferase family protein [Bacteroidales bacterium]|nr:nucleotidyltransferase family protein [Bacteroidales bacterium]